VKAVLEQEQFRTFEAEDGIQGLRLVEKLGDVLDLIVSDINMPNGDGVTFVCAVRESFPVLPIILISGYLDHELNSNISFEFVRKPFLPATLLTAIDNAMKMMKLRTRREL
jgi:DNA-binding NtrC family response regulator